jgi:hypothetical protein
MQSKDSAGSFPAQVFEEGGRRLLATILPRVDPRRAAGYLLSVQPAAGPSSAPGIRFRNTGRNVRVEFDERLLTEYHVGDGNKPYFFPLVGPNGEPYTRAYPMEMVPGEDRDHPHQRSCWFTHGNVNAIDFWSQGKAFGTIRESARDLVAEGPVLGRMHTKDHWLAPDGREVCDDERFVTFFHTQNVRVIDFEIWIKASAGPVKFGDTKEGMFGLRVASSMDVDKGTGGQITNAEGLTDQKAWGQASPWVDYAGPVHGKTVGIAVLNHPDSFRYPTTWHVRVYGLFAANPFGWHDFGKPERGDYTIPGGQAIRFRYRMILHEGNTASLGLPTLFRAYAKPPTLEFERG